jgi:ssDNA thymidine ADP-ribosyltransferase, DarT
MPKPLQEVLSPEKALVFRITHRSNLPWLLRNGLHCASSPLQDSSFVPIGHPDLIERRRNCQVPIQPGGALSDYVPFYFTPYSPMLYNIKTGFGGVLRRSNDDIVILVSSLPKLLAEGVAFVFTDRHALLHTARFSTQLSEIGRVDWALLQQRDFKRDPDNPEKFERYQAEALAFRSVPPSTLLGIGCYTSAIRDAIEAESRSCGLQVPIVVRADWYF